MEVRVFEKDKLVFFEYERLYVIGALGRLEKLLGDIESLYSNESLEFAPVKQEANRDFLAAFNFRPVVDVTFVRCPSSESSIVSYSLSKNKSIELINDLIKKIGFATEFPRDDFTDTIKREI